MADRTPALSPADVTAVRELAKRVAEIAALPVQDETRALWRDLNGLRPDRPMVMIDQLPWNEMNVDDELTLVSADPLARRIETDLRQTLYAWRRFRVDMVVEPSVFVPKTLRTTGVGVETDETTIEWEEGNAVLAHQYHDVLETPEDVARIRPAEISLDTEATAADEDRAHELLDGILGVHMQGWSDALDLWDDIVNWRGAEAVLYDFADRPDHMHEIARRYTSARLAMLDSLEEQGLLGYGQQRIHCTGAETDELPRPGSTRRARERGTTGRTARARSWCPCRARCSRSSRSPTSASGTPGSGSPTTAAATRCTTAWTSSVGSPTSGRSR